MKALRWLLTFILACAAVALAALAISILLGLLVLGLTIVLATYCVAPDDVKAFAKRAGELFENLLKSFKASLDDAGGLLKAFMAGQGAQTNPTSEENATSEAYPQPEAKAQKTDAAN